MIQRDAKFHCYDPEKTVQTAVNYCAKCFKDLPDPLTLEDGRFVSWFDRHGLLVVFTLDERTIADSCIADIHVLILDRL